MKLLAHRAGLPGNVDMITGSALTPVLESVTALPAGYPADLPVKGDDEWPTRKYELRYRLFLGFCLG